MREIRNLLLNPRPGVPGREEFETNADAIVTYLPNEVKITTLDTGTTSAVHGVTLPAGDWVFSAFVGDYTGSDECTTPENIALLVTAEYPNLEPFTGVDKRYTVQFHLDTEIEVMILLLGPNTVGESLSWSRMILASKQDYDAMRALTDANGQPLNLEWFDGDTYPHDSGGDSAS